MEVMLQAPKNFTSNVQKKKILPLCQLVEETRRTDNVTHHLLETRVYAKLKSNNVVEVAPLELHFSGFEVGKDYKKVVKLINVSSEVLDVHILPTQTKYFLTEYIKKSRLVPGLSYTITVHFSPNEWRYFFDSIRIHCKGEENLLIPLHAYPVIDDLHVPSQISLPDVPLNHSTSHMIPLSCSCPIDFEFQVHCLQSHEAFTIQPLSGVIPANGKTAITVTFTPCHYGTAEITLQLVISQFNSKPFICTLTGSCSPHLTQRQPKKKEESDKMLAKIGKTDTPVPLSAACRLKLKVASNTEKHKKHKSKSDQRPQAPVMDVSTCAGLAKMLIQPQDKMSFKNLREAISHTKTAHQARQMREASFESKVRVNVQKEKANHLQWQVHLGEDLYSTEQKMNILKKQEFATAEYMTKKDTGGKEVDFARALPKVSLYGVLRNAGQIPDCIPTFYIYGSRQLEVRQRVLRLFQQTVRKVILQGRMNNRLLLLQELVSHMKRKVRGEKDTVDGKSQLLKLSSEKLQAFTLPIFSPANQPDELAVNQFGRVYMRPFRANLTTNIPLFNLKVPQHYRLMGYQEVSAYDAGVSFVQSELHRPLRTGAQDELLPTVIHTLEASEEKELQEERGSEQEINTPLSFSAPRNLLNPLNAHLLRIFNPAPGVHAFRPKPNYLESDPEYHLCPLPRHSVCKGNIVGVYSPSTQKKFLDRKDTIKGIMIWKKFPSMALTTFACTSTLTSSNCPPCMSDPFNSSLLPLEAPPVLHNLPDSIQDEILSEVAEGAGVRLTPEMVQAEFAPSESSPSKTSKENGAKDDREKRQQLLESTLKSQSTKLCPKVLGRMKCLQSLRHKSQNDHK
ncbi:cilia- and flagella-associated protein 221 isoform X2 [Pygocentrus nattereri]|uniref:cilia- and flagella-associated protein 221 isoform X2 n=1 Tax=Pygocentrus nattereri TaxID=42514 RepID=UPI0008142187|nr:cilia- and flagella-associated protein 221 isoform X2 [Pygocentrus nattereri]